MRSGKSDELIRIMKRYRYLSEKRTLVIKPAIDTRTVGDEIASREPTENGESMEIKARHTAKTVASYDEFLELIKEENANIIGIDEIQFFDPWIFQAVSELLEENKDNNFEIIGAGLEMNFLRQPFGSVPDLMVIADKVLKLSAVCVKCQKNDAVYTQKLTRSTDVIEVGDKDTYEPRCRSCHTIP